MKVMTLFPDGETTVIAAIRQAFTERNQPLTNGVFVGTKRQQKNLSDKEITVRSDGGVLLYNGLLKEESFGVNIWAKDEKTANDLSRYLDAILRSISTKYIKEISVESSFPVPTEDKEEQRYLTVVALIKPDNFSI